MKHILASLAVTAAMLMAPAAQAEYPDSPVTFVVPFPPGDLEDVLTRMIAEDFQAEYGVAAGVMNRPGGGGGPFPGAIEVAKAPADGSVIGSFVVSVPVVGPMIGIPELDPNPFDPIGIFLTYPFIIATSADAPYQNIQELAAYASQDPVVLGVFAEGLPPSRVSMALAAQSGFSWGSVASFDALDCNTLASGDADVINTTAQLVLPCLDKIRVLAVIAPERLPLFPDAPTVAEIDNRLSLTLWNGLFVHRDTPQDIRDRIAAVAERTMRSERAQAVAERTGALVYWNDAPTAAAQIEADILAFRALGEILN